MSDNQITALQQSKDQFAVVMQDAANLDIVNNLAGAFDAAIIVGRLHEILTDEIMKTVFMPLMNKRIGFRTDKDTSNGKYNGSTYTADQVRTCIIDAAAYGLTPTGNQFNIIAGNMYPTKEGYTFLLTKLKKSMGLVYSFEFDPDVSVKSADPSYVAIPCRISYKTDREDLKGYFKYVALVKSNGATSTTDQLRGKAERKCKKAFYEFLTGLDLGDADADTVDATYVDVTPRPKTALDKARELTSKRAESIHPNQSFEQPADAPAPQQPATVPAASPAGKEQPVAPASPAPQQPAVNPLRRPVTYPSESERMPEDKTLFPN